MVELIGLTQKSPASAFIRDTDEMKFEADVLTESMTRPVIVDFWAPWCGPCKQMMPVLEKTVNAAAGAVLMVKVDIDKNPALAQALRIQSVPTVYAFYQGKPVDAFAGAKPESELKAFVEKLKRIAGIEPSAAETAALTAEQVKKIMAEGDQFFAQSKNEDALAQYSSIFDVDPENMEALGGIGWCLMSMNDAESVRGMLQELTPEQLKSPRLQGLKFILSLDEKAAKLPEITDLEKKLAKDPQLHHDLALRYLAAGQLEKGIDTLVSLIRLNREWQEQKARKFLLEVFEALGNAHPLTLSGRRKLSAVLFS